MVNSCCVFNCTNSATSEKDISFYRFPSVNKRFSNEYQELLTRRRNAWFTALKRENVDKNKLSMLRICSEHFATGKPADFRDADNPDWIPHVNMGYRKSGIKPEGKVDRYERVVNREKKKQKRKKDTEEAQFLNFGTDGQNNNPSKAVLTDTECNANTGTAIQTEMTSSLLSAMEEELLQRTEEVHRLRKELARHTWTEESFIDNDRKLKYFTGIPTLKLFKVILKQLDDGLNCVKVTKLDNFQKLLLTLMKLRYNITFVGLGYRFNIRSDEASYCFKNVIIILEYSLRYVVHWPDRDSLRTTMPESFKKSFGNSVAVIVDCFEILIERPGNVKAKAQCFSTYKHNYTGKYLIGITPHGHVSFISDGWGGRVSDKLISEKSGFLDLLLPGDIVLADRGFTIKESVSMQYAELLTPDFLCGHSQLPPSAVEKTRNIAAVRIHVERVIGNVRNKFRILKGPVSIDFLKYKQENKCFLDYIVRSCCILVNLCDSVVPMKTAIRTNSNEDVALNEMLFTDDFQYCT